jgi:hypothetical protein
MAEDKFAQYKDKFTLDGLVKPVPGVTKEKTQFMRDLMDGTRKGHRDTKGVLEEALVSTDAIFNLAHVTALNVLADFDVQPRTWEQLGATILPVSDFRPVTLYSLRPDWSAGGVIGSGTTTSGLTPRWVAPRVPEGANYPYAYMEQETNQEVGGIVKRGFKTGFTFEAFINDSVGFIQSLPDSMRNIALDTDEWEVYNALISGVGSAQELAGGNVPDVNQPAVAPNAPISYNAVWRAIIELSQRTLNGRLIVVSGGFKLVIPAGQRQWVNWALFGTSTVGYENGNPQASPNRVTLVDINGPDPIASAGITIVESEFVPANHWYLLPNSNAARRPLLQLMRLTGHDVPELRVQGNTGSYVGGGVVDPFEGNFDNDSADFRLRMFTKGILWTPELVVWSRGDSSAVS